MDRDPPLLIIALFQVLLWGGLLTLLFDPVTGGGMLIGSVAVFQMMVGSRG